MNTETVLAQTNEPAAEASAETPEELMVAVEGLQGVKAGVFEAGESIVEDVVEGVKDENPTADPAESTIEQESL